MGVVHLRAVRQQDPHHKHVYPGRCEHQRRVPAVPLERLPRKLKRSVDGHGDMFEQQRNDDSVTALDCQVQQVALRAAQFGLASGRVGASRSTSRRTGSWRVIVIMR